MAQPTEAEPAPREPATDEGPDAHRRTFRVGLALITLAAFAWRLAYTLLTHGHDTDLFDEGDGFFYSNVARTMAAGHLYLNPFNQSPAADHPPLTVLVLTPTSWLFKDSILAQRLTMTVIGTLVVVAIGLLGRQVLGWRVGLAAAAFAAANPNLWVNDAVIMSESISALLIVATLGAGYALAVEPTVKRAAIAGAVCGLTVLARAEVGLYLPLLIAPILLLARELTWRDRVLRLGVATALLGVVIAPWIGWNLTQFDKPVFLSTNDGTTTLGANCPAVYDTGIIGGWSLQCVLDTDVSGLDASEASAVQRKKGLTYMKEHSGRLPAVLVAREGRTFGLWRPDQSAYINQGEGRPKWASWACFGAFWALIPLAGLGAVAMRNRKLTLVPMAASLATVVLVSALFYGIPRFRLPLDVAMCLLAAAAVGALWERRTSGA